MATDWIFGYGSLIWRPGFQFVERARAVVPDRARRFWQGSPDHRGVPEAPGRVVTLVDAPGARCVGRVFRVERAALRSVLADLDVREQGGYERVRLEVEVAGGVRVEATTYVAPPGNPHWLGPAPWEDTVAQIRRSRGPSGANVEYVLRLAEALERLGFEDPHVRDLAAALRDGDGGEEDGRGERI